MLDAANAYFDGTLSGDKWNAYSDAEKSKALHEAKKIIAMLPLGNVPQGILSAALYEQALCLLAMPENVKKRMSLQNQGVRSIKSGNASESYTDKENRSLLDGFSLCPKVEAMLKPYASAGVFSGGAMERTRYPGRRY